MRQVTTLPTGTVTFMFSDIEGSTRILQELGDRWPELLEDHRRIVRQAIAAHDGAEMGTEGDSFFVVFASAAAAVAAAADVQRGLARYDWPAGAAVRVRIGLHTGNGTLSAGDYVGLDVHRAARIAAAGHGGQVLVSDATRSLVESDLPAGSGLRDLGRHRLKDLAAPEQLSQLDIPGLPQDFPALRALDARPNNLPVQLTSFVGRDADIAAVGDLLDRARLVTLTGPGGTGKTRLALQVAAERLSRYRDGVFFIELAPISDPGLVASAIASALEVREAADRPLTDTLSQALTDRQILLVLDNFEQVTEAARLVTDLLSAAKELGVLVTSRAVLHLSGEHEYPVAPMRIPDPASLPTAEGLSHYEAVTLFIERAMAARPDFAVSNESAPAIAEIVARLDGLPLAIELAAAKARLLGPQAILGRLGSRLAFLGSGPRDLPARQQTLRQTIDWSYTLLAAPERALLRRLAVFVGGWTLEGVEAVCDPTGLGLDAFDGLGALVDQSLIRRDEGEHGEPRFVMLETIREFASDHLRQAGEADDVRTSHARYFLAVAEAAAPNLTRSPEAIDRLGHDHDNVRAALSWAIEGGDAEVGLRLGFAMWRFWHQRAHLREGRQWFERLLALPGSAARTLARANGLTGAAGIAYWQNDYSAAEDWYVEAEGIFRELGERRSLADALFNTASMAAIRGDMEAALGMARESAAIARETGDDRLISQARRFEGYGAFMMDDLDRARPLLDEGLSAAERTGDRFTIAGGHHTVAQVARLQGRLDDAVDHYRQALEIFYELGDQASLTEPLQGIAGVAVLRGDPERGVRLLAANQAIRERIGGGPPPEWLRLGDPLGDARQVLSETAYEQAWQLGLSMTLAEAVNDALAG